MSEAAEETSKTEEQAKGSTTTSTTTGGKNAAPKSPQLHRAAPNTIYRRAILQALEYSSMQNFNSRSGIHAIRRHTKEIVADHEDPEAWNDTMFLQTLKSVVNQGDVELLANIQAELSPTYKRKRAHSLQKKLENMANAPQLPIVMAPPPPTLPMAEPHHVIIAFKDPKEPPHRPREHEKWKIIPKRIYDRTTVVNPMEIND